MCPQPPQEALGTFFVIFDANTKVVNLYIYIYIQEEKVQQFSPAERQEGIFRE